MICRDLDIASARPEHCQADRVHIHPPSQRTSPLSALQREWQQAGGRGGVSRLRWEGTPWRLEDGCADIILTMGYTPSDTLEPDQYTIPSSIELPQVQSAFDIALYRGRLALFCFPLLHLSSRFSAPPPQDKTNGDSIPTSIIICGYTLFD